MAGILYYYTWYFDQNCYFLSVHYLFWEKVFTKLIKLAKKIMFLICCNIYKIHGKIV